MTSITVGDIARRIREPGEELSAVIDRLRNWTKEGLIKPVGDRSPGTGRKRLYPERAIIDAAILSRLARYYGIWAPKSASWAAPSTLPLSNSQR